MQGQKVVCINDSWSALTLNFYTALPVKDSIYTIRAVMPGRGNQQMTPPYKFTEEIAVLLEELINPEYGPEGKKTEAGFNIERFAPLEELTEEQIMRFHKEEPVKPAKPVKQPAKPELVPA